MVNCHFCIESRVNLPLMCTLVGILDVSNIFSFQKQQMQYSFVVSNKYMVFVMFL